MLMERTFCQCFFNRETKKLIDKWMLGQIIRRHVHMANSNGQTEDLLHMELDGGFDLFNLGGHRLAVGEGGREFTSLVETRTKKTGDLLDESFTGQKGVIFLG